MREFIGRRIIWAVIIILGVTMLVFAIIHLPLGDPLTMWIRSLELSGKPVIYLYPETVTDVEVRLDLDGQLEFTYPAYNDGWHVTAFPDGRLIDHTDGNEYSYLFWEGYENIELDMESGFVVAGGDIVEFLREKLAFMGLLPKEYNEFIVYWAPRMQQNAYNLISFQWDSHASAAKLEISPAPDSMLRVYMAYKPLDSPVTVPEQELKPFERIGFAVIEWGGTEVNGGR